MKQQQVLVKQPDEETAKKLDDMVETFSTRSFGFKSRHRAPSDFTPTSKPFDVYVVSWRKSGTTLCQNIAYQMLVGAGRVPTDPDGTDFKDISEVTPFLEAASITGVYESKHPYSPAVWKSHSNALKFDDLSKFGTGRFIYLFREGTSAARSHLDFVANWIFMGIDQLNEDEHGMVYERYFLRYFLGMVQDEETGKWVKRTDGKEGAYFLHIKSWLDTALENVLYVPFDEIIKDLDTWVPLIAKFIGLSEEEISDSLVKSVIAKCDRKVMASDTRFNELLISAANKLDKNGGRRSRGEGEKSFSRFKLNEETLKLFDEQFKSVVGFDNYEALKVELCKRNEKLIERLGL